MVGQPPLRIGSGQLLIIVISIFLQGYKSESMFLFLAIIFCFELTNA